MEATIATNEAKLAELQAEVVKPENAANSSKLMAITTEIDETQKRIEKLYARWAELE